MSYINVLCSVAAMCLTPTIMTRQTNQTIRTAVTNTTYGFHLFQNGTNVNLGVKNSTETDFVLCSNANDMDCIPDHNYTAGAAGLSDTYTSSNGYSVTVNWVAQVPSQPSFYIDPVSNHIVLNASAHSTEYGAPIDGCYLDYGVGTHEQTVKANYTDALTVNGTNSYCHTSPVESSQVTLNLSSLFTAGSTYDIYYSCYNSFGQSISYAVFGQVPVAMVNNSGSNGSSTGAASGSSSSSSGASSSSHVDSSVSSSSVANSSSTGASSSPVDNSTASTGSSGSSGSNSSSSTGSSSGASSSSSSVGASSSPVDNSTASTGSSGSNSSSSTGSSTGSSGNMTGSSAGVSDNSTGSTGSSGSNSTSSTGSSSGAASSSSSSSGVSGNSTSSTGLTNTTGSSTGAASSTGSSGNMTSSTGSSSNMTSSSSTGSSAGSSGNMTMSSSSGVSGNSTGSTGSSGNTTASSSTGSMTNSTSSTGTMSNSTSSTGVSGNSTGSSSSSSGIMRSSSSTGSMTNSSGSSSGTSGNMTMSSSASTNMTMSSTAAMMSSTSEMMSSSSSATIMPDAPAGTVSVKFNIQSNSPPSTQMARALQDDIATSIATPLNLTREDVLEFIIVTLNGTITVNRRLLSTDIPVTFTVLGNISEVAENAGVSVDASAAIRTITTAIAAGNATSLLTNIAALGVVIPPQQPVTEVIAPASSSTGVFDDSDDSSSSGLSGGAIAGIVVGTIIGALLLVGLLIAALTGSLCFKRNNGGVTEESYGHVNKNKLGSTAEMV